MRMRLGILHDAEAQQRMHEREQRVAEDKKRKLETPMVRSEAEQKKHDEEQVKAEKEGEKKKEDKAPKVKIRPLSESKAIELGANFFSEAFIFAVAAGLLVWDSWRSRAKESARRDVVAERLAELEEEVQRLKLKHEPELGELREKVERLPERKYGWYNPVGWVKGSEAAVDTKGEEGAVATQGAGMQATRGAPKPASTPSGAPPTNATAVKEELHSAKPPSEQAKAEEKPVAKPPERVDSVTATKKER